MTCQAEVSRGLATGVRAMKKVYRLALASGAAGLLLAAGAAHAQISTLSVLKRGLACAAMEEGQSNQILLFQIDSLRRGFTKSQTYTLPGGADYRVYAIGDDDRIEDIDLEVFDAGGRLVAKDIDDSNVAIVNFRVTRTQKYEFKVNPYKMKDGAPDGFYSLVVVRID